jgi:hypothetical protein
MKSLSQFLAWHMVDEEQGYPEEAEGLVSHLQEVIHRGIEKYKEHLGADQPKTVAWAMLERQFITALEHMEDLGNKDEQKV